VEYDIQNILRPLKHQLTLLENEITYDETLLPQRAKVTSLIDNLSIGIAPHKNLPLELLSQIFRDVLSDDPIVYIPLNERPNHDPSGCIPVPWLLTHVCRSWRDVSLHESALWNRIDLTQDLLTKHNEEVLETVFSRGSGDFTVELEARVCSRRYDMPRLIFPNSRRFSRLSIQASHEDISKFFEALAPNQALLRSLKEFRIINLDSSMDGLPQIGKDLFQYSPLLRSFSLSMYRCSVEFTRKFIRGINIPLGVLTKLELRGCFCFRVIFHTLAQCPNLESSAFDLDADELEDASNTSGQTLPDTITLLHLREMVVHYETTNHEPRFLRRLTLPALLKLKLSRPMIIDSPPASFADLVDFLDRSRCQLESFEYNRRCELDSILERMHLSLLHLRTPYGFLRPQVMQRISKGEYQSHFLPNAGFSVAPEDFGALMNVLETFLSRRSSTKWLTAIRILSPEDAPIDRGYLSQQLSTLHKKFDIEGRLFLYFYTISQ
jgi:hypothetical protein